ncbi:hypothetical protein [Streptomyces canus]|uniref:hypothetical protein n=1 Tax=Streptomyces canus TaxID=58343 RepID=UPI0022535645|nr:hypothetical protein [Streptomyces canus]MCX4854485.1 hypothetical protein [Streptomyces canus]
MVASPVEGAGSRTMEITLGLDAEAHLAPVLLIETTLMGPTFSTVAPAVSADVLHDGPISLLTAHSSTDTASATSRTRPSPQVAPSPRPAGRRSPH